MSVLDDAFKAATKDLNFSKQRDRVRGAYVRRRAEKLIKQNPSSDALDLTVQLMGEQAQLMGYITQAFTALLNNRDDKDPKHLDLASMSKVTNSTTSSTATTLEKEYRTNRGDWIWQIVWRAVAIHDDVLWKNLQPPRELETAALDEILDRRLRAAEQLHCNVNSGGIALFTGARERKWKVEGPNGPWTDDVLVRNFEYPFLPKAPFKDLLPRMGNWRDLGDTILFSPDGTLNQANVRFARKVGKAWKVIINAVGNWPTFQPDAGLNHADVFRDMFQKPRDNFFDRNWLYCDMVGSAVSIEALEFGIQRRPGPRTNFETVMNKPGYVRLGPVVRVHGEHNLDILMSDDNDEFFENAFIDLNDVQVGDFVCFWNNHLYDLIASGAWRNEYSHIMGVDADALTGKVRVLSDGPQIWLSGHGLKTTLYNAMATELIANIKGILDDLRTRLKSAVSTGGAIPVTRSGQTLVSWSPYESFDPPGAWWIKIPKDIWNQKWTYKTLDEAVKGVPRTVAKEVGGTGYNAPPDAEAVYFPLFEPQVAPTGRDSDSWRAYLNKRKADASFRPPTQLKDLAADARLAPGLYYRGSQTTIPVVRPKVRK